MLIRKLSERKWGEFRMQSKVTGYIEGLPVEEWERLPLVQQESVSGPSG
jgi:hypothetical protein